MGSTRTFLVRRRCAAGCWDRKLVEQHISTGLCIEVRVQLRILQP